MVGKTQIDAAKEILDSLDLSDTIKLMGLVKDDKHSTNALMDTNGDTLKLIKIQDYFSC